MLAKVVEPIDNTLERALKDFGQKVDICDRIRNIVESYSNPLDLLKEAIQNADDAGASQITFAIDYNTYPSGSYLISTT